MLQEIYGSDKKKKGADFILLIIVIAVCVLLRVAINALKAYVPVGVSTAIVFVAVMVGSFFLYRFRLCEYGYTFYYKEPDPTELDAFGEPEKLPFELGTFIASRLVGGKPKVNALTHVRDIEALLAPDEPLPEGARKKLTLAPPSLKSAYRLLTVTDGKPECWYIKPSAEMLSLINEALDAKRRAMGE